ncbi:hypothetical protein MICRO116_1060004 [Micrococcus sp. 116]|nr:hypothetical protein MICRO116_1060004 [Micrococcus sp. 116]
MRKQQRPASPKPTVLRDAVFGDHGAGASWVDGRPGVSREVVAPRSVSDLPVKMIYEA